MRYQVTKEQLEAIHNTRHTRSPGGTASLLGISRQRVMQLVDKRTYDSGFLGWVYIYENRWGGHMTTVYVDLGPGGPDDLLRQTDPLAWRGRKPEEILAESVHRYEQMVAEEMAS